MNTRTYTCEHEVAKQNSQAEIESIPRRRGRPARKIKVLVSCRAADRNEDKELEESIRLVIASIVRSRMGTIKEEET